jgi:predicted nucleotide-binding protein
MPYHVRITRKSDITRDETKVDLTREQLEGQFLVPYRQGRPILIGGLTVPLDDLERIKISETSEPAEVVLTQLQATEQGRWQVANLGGDWSIADHGTDVSDEFITTPPGSESPETEPTAALTTADPQSVFVVHGRNRAARDGLFTFLRAIGLRPLEWAELVHETGSESPYIGQVLEAAFSRAQAVVVLITPDDEAKLRGQFVQAGDPPHETDLTPQGRPNVLFEAGMAFGRAPERTVLVELGTVRPFSDVAGRHAVRLDNSSQRRQELAQRLESAGCAVNLTGTDWHSAGDLTPPT